MKENKNTEKKDDDKTSYLPIGMCLGMGLGVAIGVATDNLALCMSIGMCLGMGLGAVIDAAKGKKDDDPGDGDKEE